MKNKFLIITIAAGILGLYSCDKNFEKINTDPEKLSPANMNYAYLFTAAQLTTSGNSDANAYEDWRNNLIYGATMIQHLASFTGYWGGDKYTYNASYNSAYWDVNYPSSVKNIVDVVENIKDKPEHSNFYQIARIFRVLMFHRLTDMYGDVPYSEAGLGYHTGNTKPKYDKQSDIYADMLKELEDAAGKLDATKANTVGAADLIYAGSVPKWKKLAYSLMLRLGMRLTKVDANAAKSWAAKAFAGGVITDVIDNAIINHPDLPPQNNRSNGTGSVYIAQDPNAYRLSKTLVDYLKTTKDPRLKYIATVITPPNVSPANPDPAIPNFTANLFGDTTRAAQIGMPNGYDLTGTRPIASEPNFPGARYKYSTVNRYTYARFEAPTFFVTAAQSLLLLAEAAERGYITGSASTFYMQAVTQAMNQFVQFNVGKVSGVVISAPEIAQYLADNPYTPGAAGINQVNSQYWLVSFADSYETWANWRRSGYPVLTPSGNYPGNVTNGTIPRRFTYPSNEAAVNPENYAAAVAGLADGDKMTSRVWWDKP
jgi:hypothetical protein